MENSQEENLTANTNKDLGRIDEEEIKNTNDVFLADEPGIKLPLDETFEQVKEKIKIIKLMDC